MDDTRIIDLYWQRSERAIAETDAKYGAYCRMVALSITGHAARRVRKILPHAAGDGGGAAARHHAGGAYARHRAGGLLHGGAERDRGL